MKRILVMGLPGSGKTTLAQQLKKQLESAGKKVEWLNADQVRAVYNDWDFSESGRTRQSLRMRELADQFAVDHVIADFVAPLATMRNNFFAHFTIWMDTIQTGRFEDTNKMFDPPRHYDYRVQEQDADKWAGIIADDIVKRW